MSLFINRRAVFYLYVDLERLDDAIRTRGKRNQQRFNNTSQTQMFTSCGNRNREESEFFDPSFVFFAIKKGGRTKQLPNCFFKYET